MYIVVYIKKRVFWFFMNAFCCIHKVVCCAFPNKKTKKQANKNAPQIVASNNHQTAMSNSNSNNNNASNANNSSSNLAINNNNNNNNSKGANAQQPQYSQSLPRSSSMLSSSFNERTRTGSQSSVRSNVDDLQTRRSSLQRGTHSSSYALLKQNIVLQELNPSHVPAIPYYSSSMTTTSPIMGGLQQHQLQQHTAATAGSNANQLHHHLLTSDVRSLHSQQSAPAAPNSTKRTAQKKTLLGVFKDDDHPYRMNYKDNYFNDEDDEDEENNGSGGNNGTTMATKKPYLEQTQIVADANGDTLISKINNLFTKVQSFLYITMEQPKRRGNRIGRVINFIIMILIFVSIVNFIVATVPSLEKVEWFQTTTYIVEQVCVGVFSIEFLLRFYAITAPPSHHYYRLGPVLGRLRYLISFNAIIDFCSIIPTLVFAIIYLIFKNSEDIILLRELVALRVLRVLKLLKADTYLNASALIVNCIVKKRRELTIALFLYIVTVLIIGSAVYYAERFHNPNEFGSIPLGIYWACVAMATGNIGAVPTTSAGMVINVISGIVAYTFVALPTSIIGYAFVEELQVRMNEVEEKKRKDAEDRARAMILELEEKEAIKKQEEEMEKAAQQAAITSEGNACSVTCPNCAHQFKKKFAIKFEDD